MRMKKLVTVLIMTAMLFATGVCVNTASAESVNVSAGKYAEIRKVSDDSVITSLWGPARAVCDGNRGTHGQSSLADWSYIAIDLLGFFEIDSITYVPHPGLPATAYTIYGSFDGSSWTELATEAAGGGEEKSYDFPKTTVRYVKVLPAEGSSGQFATYEVEVYGVPAKNLATAENTKAINSETGEISPWFYPGQEFANVFDSSHYTFAQPSTSKKWGPETDLGGYYNISAIQIIGYYTNYITEGTFQVSMDGVNYTDVSEISMQRIIVDDLTSNHYEALRYHSLVYLNDVTARYVRVNVTGIDIDADVPMCEYAVWGEEVSPVTIKADYYKGVWEDEQDVGLSGKEAHIFFGTAEVKLTESGLITEYGIIVSYTEGGNPAQRKFAGQSMSDGRFGIALYEIPANTYVVRTYVVIGGERVVSADSVEFSVE